MGSLNEKAAKIKLMAFDVDGVFTDGGLVFDENGKETKIFNAKDGQGIVCVEKAGIITVIITARENGTVEARAKNLGITELHQGIKYKLPVLEEITRKYNLTMENVSYMGDDLPDICILECAGLACCPNDAVSEVKQICDFISSKDGGHGAIRELCDFVLKCKNIEPLEIVKNAQRTAINE
ncbi:MAG: HAD hydrolase family protein [Candidatus Gastranaerophilales bacterium]|nr:HAD hydrolase family protein [Candidatus Gastranaerophilales bacterium]